MLNLSSAGGVYTTIDLQALEDESADSPESAMQRIITRLAALIALAPLTVFASSEPDLDPRRTSGSPRVRPYDGRSASLILEGLERSSTLRAIVDRLEQLDVIVYVEMQPALRKKLAGKMTWLTGTASHRYVRISLCPELSQDTLIATLGHELQHALEVAEAPAIVDAASLQAYYEQHGVSSPGQVNGWDSLAARAIGDEVRRELAGMRGRVVADSTRAFNPEAWDTMYRRSRSLLTP